MDKSKTIFHYWGHVKGEIVNMYFSAPNRTANSVQAIHQYLEDKNEGPLRDVDYKCLSVSTTSDFEGKEVIDISKQ